MSKKSSNFAPAFAPKTEGKQKMILERLINQDVVQEREYKNLFPKILYTQ